MSKREVIAAQKCFQDLSIEAINQLKTMPAASVQAETRYLAQKLVDQLWL